MPPYRVRQYTEYPAMRMLRANHVLSTTGATLVSGGLAFGLSILVARLLTPEQNGHYAQFVLMFNLVYILLNLGLGPASTFFIASGRASAQTVFRVNFLMIMLLSVVVIVFSFGVHQMGFAEAISYELKTPISLLLTGLFAGVLLLSSNQVLALLMGKQLYDLVNGLNILRAAVPLLLVSVTPVIWEISIASIVAAHTVGLALALAMTLLISRKDLSMYMPDSTTSNTNILRSMLNYSGLVYLSNLLHYLAMRGLLLLVSYYCTPASVGFFSLALILLEITLLLPSAFGQLVFPHSSTSEFDHNVLERVLRVNVYVSLLFVLLIFLIAKPLIIFLMGDSYATVAQVLIHLTPSVILLAVPRILSQLLSGQGHPRYPLLAAAISLVLGALLAVWVIPSWGVVGAAWVTNLVSVVTAIVTVFGYGRIHGVEIRQILTPQSKDWLDIHRLALKLLRR